MTDKPVATIDPFREPSISLEGLVVSPWKGENGASGLNKHYRTGLEQLSIRHGYASPKTLRLPENGITDELKRILTSLSNTTDELLASKADLRKIKGVAFNPSTCTFTFPMDNPSIVLTCKVFSVQDDSAPTGPGYVTLLSLVNREPGESPDSFKATFETMWLSIKKSVVRCEFPNFPEGCKGRAFRDIYQLNARLKSGSFATVCRGTHRATGKKVAIKCVLRKDLPPSDDAAIYDEVAILASIQHRYVVPLIDFFEEKECYFIIMELMCGGDLFDRIGKKKSYNERDARDLCRKMLEAMRECHSNNIAHCDMKPKNLLLFSEEDDSFIKLADFGFAARVHAPKSLTKQCGTPFFVSPEILMRSPYDQASDMWSVGCIIYLLLGGNLPFMGRSQKELFRKIVIGQYEFPDDCWSDVSEDAKDLVRGLLITDPDKRMSAEQALNSTWIQESGMRLAKNSLMFTSQRLKTFNARMKLRSAMIAVDWISGMQRTSWIKRSSNKIGEKKDNEDRPQGTAETIPEES
mmetsp:Transcript_4127/g.6212  ORF Transcript_4127/g.6212 Transcript_4127/m.6212 type:complete len:522 (+) Transcript_4127:207-1772(+)|eukprot:CAMPEP_0118693616 /NCGR_PEP_ID=MMETSP0800-20121206/12015_1 /TAXON_ID=210618 ORGANISM="Striatella unipunctata, Strain CCMP2910" /NCGR_SAMPLE_ID=MMETSP0800 /ASSEMBLY_ACC=CAM_ASM_000638 /LENGTH=521 /DNA_ID=CAMNT_0006591887 /DNA_START=239 /DNA_END=1804 /DNA_ORIENTATION=-